ncbi:MAG TPA: organic hydroperoxide resistance protein [Actinobacteria bacterium]|nr:organic hydroperoxide resistance protein [Actinomycetota bacterium]
MNSLYTAIATASGDGRNGHTRSSDGLLDVDVRIPAEMGGQGGATNPEQLFAAGYAACFHSALKMVASGTDADLEGTEITTRVSLGKLEHGGFGLAVELDLYAPELEAGLAQELLEKAHAVCPYSNAIRGNVDVRLKLI